MEKQMGLTDSKTAYLLSRFPCSRCQHHGDRKYRQDARIMDLSSDSDTRKNALLQKISGIIPGAGITGQVRNRLPAFDKEPGIRADVLFCGEGSL
ncbi:MAG: hypothetical protein WC586_03850 [Methanoregula sp.]